MFPYVLPLAIIYIAANSYLQVDAVHANAESLHIASAYIPLAPEVEARLRAARDLLGEVLSQKSKHG
jgi:hypothetical protein